MLFGAVREGRRKIDGSWMTSRSCSQSFVFLVGPCGGVAGESGSKGWDWRRLISSQTLSFSFLRSADKCVFTSALRNAEDRKVPGRGERIACYRPGRRSYLRRITPNLALSNC